MCDYQAHLRAVVFRGAAVQASPGPGPGLGPSLLAEVAELFKTLQGRDASNLARLARRLAKLQLQTRQGSRRLLSVNKDQELVDDSRSEDLTDTKDVTNSEPMFAEIPRRKLLSIDIDPESRVEEDTESVIAKENSDKVDESIVTSNEDDIDDEEEENEEEDFIDDSDLLDEDSLTSLLETAADLPGKLALFADQVTGLEGRILEEDVHQSAVQSLIVYMLALEEIEADILEISAGAEEENTKEKNEKLGIKNEVTENEPNKQAVNKSLTELQERLAQLKTVHLPDLAGFERFVREAWKVFMELTHPDTLNSRKLLTTLVNKFVLNYHYAAELDRLARRAGPAEVEEMLAGWEEEMTAMRQGYKMLGVEEPVQDQGYFAQFMSDDEDEEEGIPSRKLLWNTEEENSDEVEDEDEKIIFKTRSLLSIPEQETCDIDDIDSYGNIWSR